MRPKHLSFLPQIDTQHGGSVRKGKRKIQRPFSPKLPLHVTMRSSKARGPWSMLRRNHKWRVLELLQSLADRYQIQIYRFANVGNHIHLLIQAKSRADFQGFLREFSGGVAILITGAIKGRPRKFWDALAWSKIVDWGQHFKNTASYVLLNALESLGRRDKKLLRKLELHGRVEFEFNPLPFA